MACSCNGSSGPARWSGQGSPSWTMPPQAGWGAEDGQTPPGPDQGPPPPAYAYGPRRSGGSCWIWLLVGVVVVFLLGRASA
jgi:hypothetical protein